MRTAHDTTSLLLLTGAVLARHETQITRDLGGAASAIEAMHVIERRDKGRRRDGPDARTCGQALDDRVLRDKGRKALVSVRQFLVEQLHHRTHGHEALTHRRRQIHRGESRQKRLCRPTPNPTACRASDCAYDRDQPGSRLQELASHIQMPLHHPMARRPTMRRSVEPMATRLGEGRDIAPIGFHASAAMPIHQAVIRISDDDLVAQRLEMLRHPFTLGRGFDQNPGVWTPPEERGQSITRRANAQIDHLAALRKDPHLAFLLVQVDGTILHGWSPLLRLWARLRNVERKLPPHEGDQPLHPICVTYPPKPRVDTVIYGETSMHIVVAGSR